MFPQLFSMCRLRRAPFSRPQDVFLCPLLFSMLHGERSSLCDSSHSTELTCTYPCNSSQKKAGAAVTQPATNFLDTRLGKPPVFRGEETKWQQWYFKFGAYIMCSGDRCPELVTDIEDPAQGPMGTHHHGEVTISNQNASVGQCQTLTRYCTVR